AREILGDAIDHDLDRRLLKAIAEKGCLPCYRTVYDMDNPETVKGWDFDEHHAGFYDITMERWPTILGANNLRAAPTGALGLGALALQGVDDRADEWLATAVASTERFLELLSPDGSFFEGLSYLSYSLRTTLPFIQAHTNLVGDIDWTTKANWDGALEYIMTMQFGKKADGTPDIVNFSDARFSVFPGAISLIGDYTGNPLAGFASTYAGNPRWIYDLFWYRPDAPAEEPSPKLLNKLNDLDWIICRSGWEADDSVLAFKSGAPANHEHADRNHIMFKRHGERLLNDHVGAAYDRRNDGWKMRFTRGHNAVLIDGKGHPYIDGTEGTNDSKAYANILQYEDHGEHVWWTSDASPAYILDNYHVHQVLRSVLYAKPDIFVVIDQIRLRYRPQTVDARFFPDNGDGEAKLSVDGDRFTINRPNATLHGLVASDTGAMPRLARLEVEKETGDFPCVEVHASEALAHHVVTVLAATPADVQAPSSMQVDQNGKLWTIHAGDLKATVEMTTREPVIHIL
ncbi:MAG: heparinase II/III family protein, partial [Puniceicoccaceae bacterium]